MSLENMTEAELAKYKVDFPQTFDELKEIIETLANREHDYGTCVYAMSISAVAAFKYVAHVLGVTGFQAGGAELDFLHRRRGWRYPDGFKIVALNPQSSEEKVKPDE